MAEARATNPLIEQFRRGGVPRDLRLMAAQGLLPLKPEDVVELWTDLLGDPDEGIREASRKSLVEFPAPELLPILRSRETPADVLSWAVANRPERELREVTLQNTSLPDETIEALAPSLLAGAGRAGGHQPDAPAAPDVAARRARDEPGPEQRPAPPPARAARDLPRGRRRGGAAAAGGACRRPEPPPEPEPEPVAELEAALTEAEAKARYLTAEEQSQTEKVSVVQKIYTMTAAEKVITALKGTREERAILIRDPNRLVSSAVLGSPQDHRRRDRVVLGHEERLRRHAAQDRQPPRVDEALRSASTTWSATRGRRSASR